MLGFLDVNGVYPRFFSSSQSDPCFRGSEYLCLELRALEAKASVGGFGLFPL